MLQEFNAFARGESPIEHNDIGVPVSDIINDECDAGGRNKVSTGLHVVWQC